MTNFLFDRKGSALRRFRVLGMALACLISLLPISASEVHASDLDYSQGAVSDPGGHFVRIGLGKSVVIRLPAEARDVIVGDPSIVDAVVRTKNVAYLFARKNGQTNIFFFDARGQQIMNIDLEVTLDTLTLQKLINRALPGTRIKVDTVGQNVVLGGVAATAVEAKTAEEMAKKYAGTDTGVVNAMKISGGDQVTLKVHVVEIKRDILKQLGINIDNLALNIGQVAIDLATANPLAPTFFSGGLGFSSGNFDISASIQAMETDGVLHTLAEPTLTAISGQSAAFLAGGQFPYFSGSSCDANGRNCVNIVTYKDFGVKLGFTPVVLSGGRISLKIATEVSEITDVRTGTLATRSAETTLELPSGGSMMLAGLIRDSTRKEINGTPGLKDVPVLGALFRSNLYRTEQTELVVIVTPYIVNPVNQNQLATPADRWNPGTDVNTVLFGHLNAIYGTAGTNPNGVYHGNVGYIIE